MIRTFIATAVVVLTAAGIGIVSSIAAEPDPQRYVLPDPPEINPDLMNAAVRDLGMTPEQLYAASKKSRQAHLDLGRIRQLLGDTWAGGYLHRRDDNAFEVVVATTDGRMEERIKELHADRVVVVQYSLKELDDIQMRLRPAFIEFARKGVASMGVDLKKNRVSVGVLRGSEHVASEMAARANVPIEMIAVESVEGYATNASGKN